MLTWFASLFVPYSLRSTTVDGVRTRPSSMLMLRCSACHERFPDRHASTNHARIEHNRDYSACRVVTLMCRTCGWELLTPDAWSLHRADVHGGRARAREREWSVAASWPSADGPR